MANSDLVYIGIGANLGQAEAMVRTAFDLLHALPTTTLIERSALFRTAPIEADGDDYINAVAGIQTQLAPANLLTALQAIEQEQGRVRSHRNAARTLDMDILLYGQQQLQTASLIIPHPRLTQRAFALIPLLQIAPFITVPGYGPAHAFVQSVADQRICKIAT